jgi:endonuclease/exonuclease/phosphatase (EEP) superfamily protein YafD
MGFRDSVFEVGVTLKGSFLLATQVCVKASRFFFTFVGVYGPADHSRSGAFLAELEQTVSRSQFPVLVAGDFNLIRGRADKSNRNIDWPRVNLFNDCIAHMFLSDVARTGARFTWSNQQRNPIRSVLDRVLVSPVWETMFPLMSLRAEPSIGSDHTPLIFSSGEESTPRSSRFLFEKS